MRKLLLLLVFASAMLQAHDVVVGWNWTQGTGDPATSFTVLRGIVVAGPFGVLPAGQPCSSVPVVAGQQIYSCDDTSVVGGNTYFYVIQALNATGSSANSPTSPAAAIPLTVPNPPTNPTVIAK